MVLHLKMSPIDEKYVQHFIVFVFVRFTALLKLSKEEFGWFLLHVDLQLLINH